MKPDQPIKTGEISQYKVLLDLKKRGFKVFRVVGQPSPAHFIIQPGNKTVVVRTASKLKEGLYIHPIKGRYSVVAKVLGDEIFYEPKLKGENDV